jgi:uncharacterized delta-60 repeat protein
MKKITPKFFVLFLLLNLQAIAQVNESWVSLYNYEGTTHEEPTDMVVDAEGNIYITGYTTSEVRDFITIKYNASGELLWSQFYDGPIHENDVAEAVAVDDSGNVYVTGSSRTQTWGDIVIIKYSPDGEQIWLQYYDNNSTDGGYDIGIGENGMIYAVGYSNADMITLQYNPAGELQWAATYDGTADDGLDIGKKLVLDASSNVYITGYTTGAGGVGSNREITTIKYNASGMQQWVAVYDGPGNSADEGYDIALDELNNVYVVGYSNAENSHVQFATIKYNEDGEEVWVNRYYNPETLNGSPSALAVFDSDNIYVTGSAGLGVSIVKISNAGDTVWTQQYNRGQADQKGTDIITDMDGNIYVTGWVRTESGMWSRDYGTMKYSPDGELLWDIWYQGLGVERDDPKKICLDHENNVIVTGETNTGTTSYDIGTIKYIQTADAVEEIWHNNPDFIIHPNPTSSIFSVQASVGYLQGTVIEVFNLNGIKLLEKHIKAGTERMEIDVSNLQNGVYFCRLIAENKSTTQKLIIQK